MVTNSTVNGGRRFRISRPLGISTAAYVATIDPTVAKQLDQINDLLARKIFDIDAIYNEYRVRDEGLNVPPPEGQDKPADGSSEGQAPRRATALTDSAPAPLDVWDTVELELKPKKAPGNVWAEGSLARTLYDTHPEEVEGGRALAECIDVVPKLANLKYTFQSVLADSWSQIEPNTKAVLDKHPAIGDYLVAYAYHRQDSWDPNGLKNFILKSAEGARKFVAYAAVSAARAIIHDQALNVPDYNNDTGAFIEKLTAANLPLTVKAFPTALEKFIKEYLFDTDEEQLILQWERDLNVTLPARMKPQLVRMMQRAPVPITSTNVNYFLPTFITELQTQSEALEPAPAEPETEPSESDFDVQFLADDASMVQVSRANVLCAAQLYYVMVLGDELDIFNTVNYFTHKFLVRGDVEIRNRALRTDLRNYVFSDLFRHPRTNELCSRTRAPERQMFYLQVFGQGGAEAGEDVIVNSEFQRLWKLLLYESVEYLRRANASYNPDSFLSKQNVMQAVEDLRYNVSNHSRGMVNVASPLMNAELDFVIRRILMHEDVLRQIVPIGSTWWRAVEQLQIQMKRKRPKATVLYNKAKLGYQILRSVADYDADTFDEDERFSAFISQVDAFITTQSILQKSLEDDLASKEEEEVRDEPELEPGATPQMAPTGARGAAAGAEWVDV